MKLTCTQMDVLISFYIDGDLSPSLKIQVEEHIKKCSTCRAKYEIINSMITDLRENLGSGEQNHSINDDKEYVASKHYSLFQNNLSAYIDNELTNDENLKIKKITINNKVARKELENCYNIRRLLKESLNKTKTEAKRDFSKSILRQLELEEEATLGFHPVIKLIIAFTITVLVITSLVLISLSV